MGKSKRFTTNKQSLPISVFADYEAGIRSAKSTLCRFYGSAHMDFHSKEMWEAVKKSLKLIKETSDDEPWGRIQWGNHPWQAIEVKDKWEFLEKYIKPVIEKYRPLIHEYDELTQSVFGECESKLNALEATISKAKAQPLAEHGGDRTLVQKTVQQGDNITLNQKGTSREYLAARLSRDCPEVLDEIGKGKKYKSVRAAAIAAGIIKPKVTIQFLPEESGSQIAGRLRQKLAPQQFNELRDALNDFPKMEAEQ